MPFSAVSGRGACPFGEMARRGARRQLFVCVLADPDFLPCLLVPRSRRASAGRTTATRSTRWTASTPSSCCSSPTSRRSVRIGLFCCWSPPFRCRRPIVACTATVLEGGGPFGGAPFLSFLASLSQVASSCAPRLHFCVWVLARRREQQSQIICLRMLLMVSRVRYVLLPSRRRALDVDPRKLNPQSVRPPSVGLARYTVAVPVFWTKIGVTVLIDASANCSEGS